MKHRTIIFIISFISTILLSECLVYLYILQFISTFNNQSLKYIYTICYWAVLPLFIAGILLIWNKYYRSQNPLFSGKIFRIAGLFVLVYIPKIILASTLIIHLLINEKPVNVIPFIGLCLSGIAFVIILFGITSGRFRFRVTRINLTFEKLPESFNGLKIIQISDLHAGSLYRNIKKFGKVVRIINNERPDLIFFTGDIVNEFAGELDGWENIFGHLNARYGKFSVLGNHDYGDYYPWKSNEDKEINIKKIIDFETRMGFRVLMNESALVNINGQEINILGVENWGLKMFKRYGRLEKAMEGLKNENFKILLSHDPSHWDAEIAGRTNVGLTLSGHTHGFQFGIRTRWFKWSPVKRFYPRWEGLHQAAAQYLYVNTGLGYIGFPGRIGIPPEIAVIKLNTKK